MGEEERSPQRPHLRRSARDAPQRHRPGSTVGQTAPGAVPPLTLPYSICRAVLAVADDDVLEAERFLAFAPAALADRLLDLQLVLLDQPVDYLLGEADA